MILGILLFIAGMFIATQNTQSRISMPLIVVGLVLFATAAHAQEHKHPPEHADIHHRFYKTWNMPDNRAVSCCHDEDCKPAPARRVDGKWQAQESGEWVDIPPNKVETNRDSPDGQSHLCGGRFGYTNGRFVVFCFLPAAGG